MNFANVKKLLAEMEVKGYRKAEMVQVLKAEEVIGRDDIVLVGIDEKEISPEAANQYFLIIDGQHRFYAASMLNYELEEKGEPTIQVPGMLAELTGNETVAEYISAVNITKNPWKTNDYVRGAANVKQEELLTRLHDEIQRNVYAR